MTQNIHETITAKIIEQLQAGTAPWRKPWTHPNASVAFQLPINATTGKRYRGINIPLLWGAVDDRAFTTNEYATFKQWAERKEFVRKGEKGNLIVFYDVLERENDKQEIDKIPYLKTSFVFNRCQLQSYTAPEQPADEPRPLLERLEAVDSFIHNTGAIVRHDGGNRAYYSRLTDDIHMPEPEIFTGTPTQTAQESYYAVSLHELTHWTGKDTRCNRQFGKRFGDRAYAFEELVAEMGSAFTCAYLGITDAPRPDHVSYLTSWLEVLRDDKRAILTAASEASKALDYLAAFQGEVCAP
ncbi:ArdC family protein [Spirosoma sp. KUDC1026]|uniref:ArdC family protein n=1 Tax=Spirosoma sp. KUDC1026 TaxID=2745947 RepID=UPI00159BE650|nr:zincin-like metallopeptidase domain-containing protein [Spirosoma sp. KUDC1026]QKZ15907.1 DUF1738 domain-containing protein [Spirosoma sp. KUDC1026]